MAIELDLPDIVLEPIASAIDFSVCQLAWAHQLLLNLHPELGKPGGGFRTIAKTPKLYRLWARTRRSPIASWEASLDKPYDSTCKGSSSLIAAATRSVVAEIAVRNDLSVCGLFFDLQKFFDTVRPLPLLSAFVENDFRVVDALMGSDAYGSKGHEAQCHSKLSRSC